jgi:hypothetical protein
MMSELCVSFRPQNVEGAGKAGCALHPRSRVQFVRKKAHTSIQVQRRQSGFPCAVVYGLLRALPGDRAFLPPSLRNVSCKAWRQHRGARTTRLRRPPHARSSVAHSASTASHRNVRDDREPPLIRVRRARPTPDLPDALSGIFFARGLDDPNHVAIAGEIGFYAHRADGPPRPPIDDAAWLARSRAAN